MEGDINVISRIYTPAELVPITIMILRILITLINFNKIITLVYVKHVVLYKFFRFSLGFNMMDLKTYLLYLVRGTSIFKKYTTQQNAVMLLLKCGHGLQCSSWTSFQIIEVLIFRA